MKRIERIINIIFDEERKATTEMVNCQRHYDEQLRLLNELFSYESDYRVKFSSNASVGVSIENLHNYNNFMRHLKKTIEHQKSTVSDSKNKTEKSILLWQSRRKKRFSLEKLNSRLDAKEMNELSRLEQKEQDEMASYKFQRLRPKHNN